MKPLSNRRVYTVTITSKGQFTWPPELQHYVGLRPGSEIEIVVQDDTLVFTIPRLTKPR